MTVRSKKTTLLALVAAWLVGLSGLGIYLAATGDVRRGFPAGLALVTIALPLFAFGAHVRAADLAGQIKCQTCGRPYRRDRDRERAGPRGYAAGVCDRCGVVAWFERVGSKGTKP